MGVRIRDRRKVIVTALQQLKKQGRISSFKEASTRMKPGDILCTIVYKNGTVRKLMI